MKPDKFRDLDKGQDLPVDAYQEKLNALRKLGYTHDQALAWISKERIQKLFELDHTVPKRKIR